MMMFKRFIQQGRSVAASNSRLYLPVTLATCLPVSKQTPNKVVQQGHKQPQRSLVSSRKRMLKRGHPARPQVMHEPEAYPRGYVEDSCEPRTMLVPRFSIRLEEPLASEEERPWHPRMRHTQPDTAFPLIDEVPLIQEIHNIEAEQELLPFPR